LEEQQSYRRARAGAIAFPCDVRPVFWAFRPRRVSLRMSCSGGAKDGSTFYRWSSQSSVGNAGVDGAPNR
jgi:hypothetical protein